jgi:hypothetical protein
MLNVVYNTGPNAGTDDSGNLFKFQFRDLEIYFRDAKPPFAAGPLVPTYLLQASF